MSRFVIAAAVAASTASATYNSTEYADAFADFKKTYGKTYESDDEEQARLNIFAINMEKADRLNEIGGASFGVTKFADMTAQEFKTYLNYLPSLTETDGEVATPGLDATEAPANFDWREKEGVVSAVKDQGQCGSCWAYSTTEAIESQWVLAGNDPAVLSAQQIISCDKNYGDEGCDGGDTLTAYKYVQHAGGLVTEKEYPATSSESGRTGVCKRFSQPTLGKIDGHTFATPGCTSGACNNQDEDKMVANVATTGPASICVNAENWQLYNKGVMTGKHCGGHAADDLDHCVQVVGYNGYSQDADDAYWIVRNSWNTDWGEKGYIYVELGDNACGIANEATFPTIAK
eukprot:CAMPEP_0195520036 /NCGR_PEP_ID=MMETSP0794_2-20130614/15965_1 /TAXON_ID=515487 /ORGANISM="Stephanopyxis turris, Strain CCMP 815" /LENGTH=345 /DNA_ID=CAMNT_0040649305 /DNA_START=69 /DNA_END=1106 /DNA_ORIENTATION=+